MEKQIQENNNQSKKDRSIIKNKNKTQYEEQD